MSLAAASLAFRKSGWAFLVVPTPPPAPLNTLVTVRSHPALRALVGRVVNENLDEACSILCEVRAMPAHEYELDHERVLLVLRRGIATPSGSKESAKCLTTSSRRQWRYDDGWAHGLPVVDMNLV